MKTYKWLFRSEDVKHQKNLPNVYRQDGWVLLVSLDLLFINASGLLPPSFLPHGICCPRSFIRCSSLISFSMRSGVSCLAFGGLPVIDTMHLAWAIITRFWLA